MSGVVGIVEYPMYALGSSPHFHILPQLEQFKLQEMSTFPLVTLGEVIAPGIAYGAGTAWFGSTGWFPTFFITILKWELISLLGPDGVSRALVDSVKTAISSGFTHLDNAEAYA